MAYVFIHGGGSTARFWDRLLPHLDRPALAVDLPGRNGKPADFATLSVDDEVASVLADVEAADAAEPIIIVAHSSGGLVVPGVVAGLGDRVAHVVLSAALVPAEGGRGIDCMKPRHRDGLVASVEQARRDGTVIALPGPPEDPEPFRYTYGGDPLDDDGEPLVVLEGSPLYYGHLGFEHSVPHGIHITLPDWAPPEAAQIMRLRNYDASLRGHLVYPPAFDALSDH